MYSVGDIEAVATLNDAEYRKKLGQMPGAAESALSKVGKIAAGYLTFRAGIAAIKDTVSAFIVQENAVNSVRAALRKQGAEYNLQTQALEKYAGELQNVTTYGDETTLAAMAQGMNMGIAAGRIKEATKAAMGLAAAYNMDLNTAMQLVAKASAGNVRGLKAYNIQIDESKSKQEKFNDVLKIGAEGFQIAEANAKTTGGRLISLGNAWGDLKEQVGRFVVELFSVRDEAGKFTNLISEATQNFSDNLDEWVLLVQTAYVEIEAAIKRVWAFVEPVVTFCVEAVSSGLKNIWSGILWLTENVGTILGNIGSVVSAVCEDTVQHFKDLAQVVGNLITNLIKAIWQAIKGGGTQGFKELWEQLMRDSAKTIDDFGKKTREAWKLTGELTAFPELQGPNYGAVVDKYRKLGNTLGDIDEERIKKQVRIEAAYRDKLAEKNQSMQDGKKGAGVAAEGKRDTLGSFSAAILAGLLGSSAPEKETAKNTREMVPLMRRMVEKSGGAAAVTAT